MVLTSMYMGIEGVQPEDSALPHRAGYPAQDCARQALVSPRPTIQRLSRSIQLFIGEGRTQIHSISDSEAPKQLSRVAGRNAKTNALPVAVGAPELLALQRSAGNDAVARLIVQRGGAVKAPARPHGTPPPSQVGQGPNPSPTSLPASTGNLRPLLEGRLEAWKRAAETGVENFADAELLRQIEESKSFDPEAFLTALVGNVIWAAACFTPVGMAATAFAISLGGIAIAAIPSMPKSRAASPLMQIKTGMQGQLDQVHRGGLQQVASLTDKIVASKPGIDVEEALEIFMLSNFPKQFLERGSSDRLTNLAEEPVRSKYEIEATKTLRQYVSEVAPIGSTAYLGMFESDWQLIRIEGVGLAIAAPMSDHWFFRAYVESEMKEQALKHAKAAGQGPPPLVAIDDISRLP
jgi:hypothetical protein